VIKIGVYLRWKQATGASYDTTQIFRATLEAGPYVQIASQAYSDTNYYDIDGTSSHWYKIRFYDSVALKYSDYSDGFQGGTWTGYCTIDDVRTITNLTETDISDANMCSLISMAGQMLNHEISVYIEDETIGSIDEVKENTIDGANVTYYTYYYPIGDFNNTFKVDISDVKVYEIDSSTTPATRTQLTVSSITPNTGQFTLSIAPTADKELLVTYRYVPLSVSDPHALVRLACMNLTASLAYQKLNVGKSPKFRMGNVSVERDMSSFKVYYDSYKRVIQEITDRSMVDIRTGVNEPGTGPFVREPESEARSKTTKYD
jgi:hypothetical protein